jgi:2-polyprenyl-3-methyl-5-hydroxy-6-metoxy-1,4-benzoquinol methylase
MTDNRRDFDKEAAQWDKNPVRVKLAKDVCAAIIKQVPLNRTMNIMDFGCGTGLLTIEIAPMAGMVTGVDSSQGMIDVLLAKTEEQKIDNVQASCLNIEHGDLLTGSYDIILSSMTLHHIENISMVLRQFHNCLVPGGYLCIADLDPDEGLFHEDNRGVFHFGFERAGIYCAFMKAGFGRISDSTATELVKNAPNGEMKRFTIFLMVGRIE